MHAADGCRAGVATDLLHSRALRAMHEDDISHKPEVCFGVEPLHSLLQHWVLHHAAGLAPGRVPDDVRPVSLVSAKVKPVFTLGGGPDLAV